MTWTRDEFPENGDYVPTVADHVKVDFDWMGHVEVELWGLFSFFFGCFFGVFVMFLCCFIIFYYDLDSRRIP